MATTTSISTDVSPSLINTNATTTYDICETLDYCQETDILTTDPDENKTIITEEFKFEIITTTNSNKLDKAVGGSVYENLNSKIVASDPLLNKSATAAASSVMKKSFINKFSSLKYKSNDHDNKNQNTKVAIVKKSKPPVITINNNEENENIEEEKALVSPRFLTRLKNGIFSNKIKKKPVVAASSSSGGGGEDGNNNGREKWDRKTEFLLAIIGFSVDLGNVWRFPKVVFDNGGGRFMIPYFIQLILCGIPLFYMELVLGQFHQTGVFTLWDKICPLFKGLAFAAVVVNLLLAMFYNTVIAWAAYYLYLSFRAVVPWQNCDNPWNTDCCFPLNQINEIHKRENLYYNISDSGLIYRQYSNKLILFNHDKSYATLEHLKEILNMTQLNVLANGTFNESSLVQSSLNSWLKLYYVLFDSNDTVVNAPYMASDSKIDLDMLFDTNTPIKLLDKEIGDLYQNESHRIVLNCSTFTSSPTQEFYSRFLTEMHLSRGLEDIGGIKWEIAVCLFAVFVTVYFALWKGIKSAGKAVWVTAIAPYIVMIILLIRGLTLDGWWDGVRFYLGVTDWSSILEYKVWVDAAAQIFFSLGPGFGTIIALASYNKKSNNCYRDALLTSFINCLTSVLSGFVVFTTLGHMAKVQGKSVENVIVGGPGLVFVTYPQAISMMPFAPFWAVIFFFMLFTLGIDSTFGGLESVITGICDVFPNSLGKRRAWFVLFLVTFCYIAALPTVTHGGPYIVHLLDNFAVTPALMIIALLEIIGVMYLYGHRRFCNDIYQMLHIRPSMFWQICWRYISPAIVLAMTIITCKEMFKAPLNYGDYFYTGLGQNLAIAIVAIPLMLIVLYMPYKFYVTKGSFIDRLRRLTVEPNEQPARNSNKMFISSLMNRNINNNNNNNNDIIVTTTNNTNQPTEAAAAAQNTIINPKNADDGTNLTAV